MKGGVWGVVRLGFRDREARQGAGSAVLDGCCVSEGYILFAAYAATGLPGRRHEAAAKLLYATFLWRSNAFPNGCFLFAAFAAGLVRNTDDPGLPPGATLSRSFAAL